MTDSNDWEFRIAKLDLQEGDVLVVKGDHRVQHDMIVSLIPRGVRVLYIPNDVELSVLTRTEIEARAA